MHKPSSSPPPRRVFPKRIRHKILPLWATLLAVIPVSGLLADDVDKAEGSIKTVQTRSYAELAMTVSHHVGASVPAAQDSTISAQISAVIKKFHADTAYEVEQGQLLVSLDCREHQLRLQQAEASLRAEQAMLKNAISQFSQAKKLNQQGNISRETYNQREAEENRLRASVAGRRIARQLAAIDIERCQIRAPFDGYIRKRLASAGELTQKGSPLLQIISKQNNLVEVTINSRQLNSFVHGRQHRYQFHRQEYPLQIEHVVPLLDGDSHNHLARLRFTGEHALTGSIGKVLWEESNTALPAAYVVQREYQGQKRLGILLAESASNGELRARFLPVDNAIEGLPARVQLDAEAQIITRGRYQVNDGDRLRVRRSAE